MQTIRIGALPGSNGYVLVDGKNGSSTLYTESSLCIGGDSLGCAVGLAAASKAPWNCATTAMPSLNARR